MKIRTGIIILSDKASRGERKDESGPLLRRLVQAAGWVPERLLVIPDDKTELARAFRDLADRRKLDLVLTSGGTGLGPRDITPEVTRETIEKEVPGIAEMLRFTGYRTRPTAVLSRGMAGSRGGTLIINLPGSPAAAAAGWERLRKIVPHALEVLQGRAFECSRTISGNGGSGKKCRGVPQVSDSRGKA